MRGIGGRSERGGTGGVNERGDWGREWEIGGGSDRGIGVGNEGGFGRK